MIAAPAENGSGTLGAETRRLLLELGYENPDAHTDEVTKVQLYRRDSRSGKYEWLETFEDPSSFDLALVRSRWGGGSYLAKLQRAGGAYLVQPAFSIAGPSLMPAEVSGESSGPASELAQLRAELAELKAATARPSERHESPALEMVKMMVPIMTAMSTAQASAMAPLLEALSKRDRPALDPLELFDRLNDMIERRVGGGNGAGAGYGDVIRDVGLPLLARLQDMAAREPAPAAPALPNPAAASPMTERVLPPWAQLIRPHLDGLLTLATVRADPSYPVERLLAAVSEEELSFITDQLDRGQEGREEFFALFPETMRHRAWIERFFDALDQALPEDQDDAP